MRIAVLGLLVALIATGCGLGSGSDPAAVPQGCGDCADEVAALTGAIEELDEVRAVAGTHRAVDAEGTLSVTVEFEASDIRTVDMQQLVDLVAEQAWKSQVNPLDTLFLTAVLSDGYTEGNQFPFGRQQASYEDRWGERPSGTVWTDTPPEGPDGPCADGCRELTRDIARSAADLPGVQTVTRVDYLPDSPTGSEGVRVGLTSAAGADPSEAVAELVWKSRLSPIKVITVEVLAGEELDSRSFSLVAGTPEHASYVEAWGERPAG